MLWQFSFAEMPGKLVQQYERTLSSSSTGKKTTAWHQSWNPGWFWKTIDPNNSWTSRIIHKKQTYSRPPDPKSIWVLKYPCQKIPSTKQNPPPQFGKLFFLNIYISKQLPPFNGTTHTTERNKNPPTSQPLPGCDTIWYLHQDLDATTDQGWIHLMPRPPGSRTEVGRETRLGTGGGGRTQIRVVASWGLGYTLYPLVKRTLRWLEYPEIFDRKYIFKSKGPCFSQLC